MLAINAHGDALLADMVAPDHPAALDGASTARFLVRLMLPPKLVAGTATSVIDAATNAQPGFPELAAAIAAQAARGEPIATSAATIAQAGPLAVRVAESLDPSLAAAIALPRSEAGARSTMLATATETESKAAFVRYRALKITDASPSGGTGPGGTMRIENTFAAPFLISHASFNRPKQIATMAMCLLCVESVTGRTSTVDITLAADGPTEVTVALDKMMAGAQILLDGVSMGVMTLNAYVGESATVSSKAVAMFDRGGPLAAILGGADVKGFAVAIGNSVLSLTIDYLKENAAKAAARSVASAFFPILRAVQVYQIGELGGRVAIQWATIGVYWNLPPETATVCFEGGALYGGCSASISIAPEVSHAEIGKPGPVLTATVYDAQKRVMTGRKVKWVSSSPDVVSVTTPGAAATSTTATATALSEGASVTITATTATARGTAVVASEACDPTWIYGTWTATYGLPEGTASDDSVPLPFFTNPG
ncbi:MAG TPA: hypothetical protein VFJ74_14010, partial [Gemmatimonadaceae bacterium]|nr:hypothetical protein [Gemmatimonadaceae bacterium]